jgi:hypothetical protein
MAADPILIIAIDPTANAIPREPHTDRQLSRYIVARDNPPSLVLAARTAVAAVVSYLIARLFRLPEAYWAKAEARRKPDGRIMTAHQRVPALNWNTVTL